MTKPPRLAVFGEYILDTVNKDCAYFVKHIYRGPIVKGKRVRLHTAEVTNGKGKFWEIPIQNIVGTGKIVAGREIPLQGDLGEVLAITPAKAKKMRLEAGLSRGKFAQLLGWGVNTVTGKEHRNTKHTWENADRLAYWAVWKLWGKKK